MGTLTRVLILILGIASHALLCRGANLRVVAYEGGPAPNVPGAVFGTPFGWPTLNADGQVAFLAKLVGRGASLWSEGDGSLRMVAEEGQPAPGLAGENFWRFNYTPAINNSGKISFRAEYGINNQAIWIEREGGSLELIAARGESAIGSGGNHFTYPYGPAVNDAGQYLFYSQLENSLSGLWSDASGTRAAIAIAGQQPVDVPMGAKFSIMLGEHLSEDGHITFAAYMAEGSGDVTADNRVGIWSDREGPMKLIYRTGSQAPGTPTGAIFRDFTSFRVNEVGKIALLATLKPGGGGVSGYTEGIWAEGSGSLDLVTRRGSQAPGAPLGASFITFSSLAFNNEGSVVFQARLLSGAGGISSSNDDGIWATREGVLSQVVREGDDVPGLPGAKFSDLGFSPANGYLSHSTNRIAFTASMQHGLGGVTAENASGLWVQDFNGVPQLVARTGDQIAVTPTDIRTIASLDYQRQSSNSHLAFQVTFRDGTRANVVATLPTLDGDFNDDSVVDGEDFLVWQRGGSPHAMSVGDLELWKRAMNSQAASATFTVVPEPPAGLLATILLSCAAMHLRRAGS